MFNTKLVLENKNKAYVLYNSNLNKIVIVSSDPNGHIWIENDPSSVIGKSCYNTPVDCLHQRFSRGWTELTTMNNDFSVDTKRMYRIG